MALPLPGGLFQLRRDVFSENIAAIVAGASSSKELWKRCGEESDWCMTLGTAAVRMRKGDLTETQINQLARRPLRDDLGFSALSQEMATQASLLASLLPHFRDEKAENIMTLALFHVLQKYPCLQRDLVDWIFKKVPRDPPANIRMMTQAQMTCDDGPDANGQRIQPDICFLDDSVAGTVLMIENKFLADLTSNQPVEYIELLSTKRSTGLVLIAPQSQVHHYRKLCLERILVRFPHARPDEHCVFIGQKFFFLVSWEELIKRLYDQGSTCTAPKTPCNAIQCDIAQLEGIRIKMEGNKTDPFKIEELAALKQIAGRIPQIFRISEKVTEELRKRFDVGKVTWSSATLERSHTQHGLNLRIHGKQFWLLPDFKLLAEVPWNGKEGFPLFWLRAGFDKWWGNNVQPPQQREQVRAAMQATSETVLDNPAQCYSMLLPFEPEQTDEHLVNDLIETLIQFRTNLGNRLNANG